MAEGGIGCTESETGCSNLYSRHSKNYVESVSVEICSIMTRLGYSEEIRRWRIEKYKENDRIFNALNAETGEANKITAGSKAEGLTNVHESDMDVLAVFKGVLCVEAGINLHTIPEDIDVFRMDTRVYQGHCILLQERPANARYDVITNALCDDGYGDVILSSSLFLDKWQATGDKFPEWVVYHERAGPSMPISVGDIHHGDRVLALRCHYPSILQKWAARPRYWPSPDIVKKVVSLGAYVTPVGFRHSLYKHIEWRICFNTGEAELVNNLHETQTKIYVILKMIVKDIMKPQNKEITSYVLKNIILWQAENTPQTEFHERNLLHWLHDGLRELRTAIEIKQLRYYMIPDRNLMAACGLGDVLQHKWVADITEMLEEGPRVILRLPKIRQAIVASPEPMLWFSKKKMEMEMLYLVMRNRHTQNPNVFDDSDCIQNAIMTRLTGLSIEIFLQMIQEGSSLMSVFTLIKYLFK
ncbi:uncharacterized protein LOC127873924 [Dreissena polymorpha]|uniref:uncharacterized protein LOC127873924 n=1 Tax=Dreissena polymorpha TaxID=45954 RepID=UPI0022640A12|nr:uncharacterized protein LOC127873924 [Dreissena polymorpha]XP_052273993.1 uncharacterized protein LOC127873924 [Dreissena polymorpha]